MNRCDSANPCNRNDFSYPPVHSCRLPCDHRVVLFPVSPPSFVHTPLFIQDRPEFVNATLDRCKRILEFVALKVVINFPRLRFHRLPW